MVFSDRAQKLDPGGAAMIPRATSSIPPPPPPPPGGEWPRSAGLAITNLERFDAAFYLSGDEETGVGLMCRHCDRGGAPVAYCTWDGDRAYVGTDVVIVHTPTTLIAEGLRHLAAAHPL